MNDGAAGGPRRGRPPQTPAARDGGDRSGGTRRPVSSNRYLVRRFVVLAVLGLVVYGAVKVVTTLTDQEPSAVSATTVDPPAPGASAPAAGATSPPTAAPTSAAPAAPAVPTPESPARVLIIGDSDAGTFGPYLDQLLGDDDPAGALVETTLDYKVSSGLARPDFYDWPAELARQLAEVNPDIVIATFGGNDSQGLSEPCPNGAGSCSPSWVVGDPTTHEEEWTAEYVRRVDQMLDLMLADGRYVIWVGIPNDDSAEVTARLRVQDQAVRQAIEGRERVRFVDTWDLFDGLSGGYARIVPDPRDGKAKPIRREDGFHLNETGAEILALSIYDELAEVLTQMGATVS